MPGGATTGLPMESFQGGELDVAELARGLMKLGIMAPWQLANEDIGYIGSW